MEVILLEKVPNLGSLGDKVKVRAGYGRNYLIPGNKAVAATEANSKMFDERRAELEKVAAETLAAAQTRADSLAQLGSITIQANASDEGKLFGSIGPVEIADAVTAAGVEIAKSEVLMPAGPVHEIGETSVDVRFHSDVIAAINVTIEAAQ